MIVTVKQIGSEYIRMTFNEVKDVSEGACGMLLIQMESKNILYRVEPDCFVEIIK